MIPIKIKTIKPRMKIVFTILNFLICTCVFSQKVNLSGNVISNKIPLENVNIINVSTSEATNSNQMGEFSLIVKLADTLTLTYLGMETIIKVINQRDLESPKLTFNMVVVSSKLDEVKINTIDAVSLGIIPKRVKPLTSNERKFVGESEINSVNLTGFFGFGIGLVPLINAINGRTKELKNNIQLEKKEAIISHLKFNYTDYLTSKLKLKDDEILIQFYYYLVDLKGIESEVYNQNTAQVNFFLFNKYLEFKDLNKEVLPKS